MQGPSWKEFFLHLVHAKKQLLLLFIKVNPWEEYSIFFEIGYGFWAHKNGHPNFDRSIKNIILILFNGRWIDFNKEAQV